MIQRTMKHNFPILNQTINGYQLRYLDNAATSQKPRVVIDAITDFYATHNANIYRGTHVFAENATQAYENARAAVAQFIGAQEDEIVFTGGCTESLNYVAAAWAMSHVGPGDTIIISALEHHANILPWQRVVAARSAQLRVIPMHADGTLNLVNLNEIIGPGTKLVSVTHTSNALGTVVDLTPIIQRAHEVGALICIDAAQAVAHTRINVRELDCDFLAFSGHKLFGPTGIGVLYIKKAIQSQVEPYQVGGGMVFRVSWAESTYLKSVNRFEAGTPAIAQAIGLAAAIQYVQTLDVQALGAHEAALCAVLIEGLEAIPGVRLFGPVDQLKQQGHMVSFALDTIHPHDIAAFLSELGICVRAGNHCAQPLFTALGLEGSVRVSFAGYNTLEDVAFLLKSLSELVTLF
jgi:cysteine desulfurase / selenocysteine lyase